MQSIEPRTVYLYWTMIYVNIGLCMHFNYLLDDLTPTTMKYDLWRVNIISYYTQRFPRVCIDSTEQWFSVNKDIVSKYNYNVNKHI